MKVLQHFRKFRVLWHGRAELTKVSGRYKYAVPVPPVLWHGRTDLTEAPGTGMNVVYTALTEVLCTGMDFAHNSQKFRARVIPGYIHAFGGGVRIKVGDFIQLAWHRLTGPRSPRQSVAVWAISTTTTEAINRELQRVATGATAALTATDHSTAYPGGGA